MRLSYRAAKERILKMSIYDSSSGGDIASAINNFMNHSGTAEQFQTLNKRICIIDTID